MLLGEQRRDLGAFHLADHFQYVCVMTLCVEFADLWKFDPIRSTFRRRVGDRGATLGVAVPGIDQPRLAYQPPHGARGRPG